METPYNNNLPQAGGRDQVEQILDMLVRRKWIIVVTFLLVAGAVAVNTFTMEPEFEAHSFVMLELNTKANLANQDTPSPGENLFARNDRTIAGELNILQLSNNLEQRVSQRLEAMYEADSSVFTSTLASGYTPLHRLPPSHLKRLVQFNPAGQGGVDIIQITGISHDPYEASLLANLFGEEYVQLTREASRTHITASRKLLEDQERKRRTELVAAEEQVRNYMSREGTVGLSAEGSSLVSQIASLEAQKDDARIELQMRQGSLNAIEKEIEEINPQLAKRIASTLEQQIQNLQERLAQKEIEKDQILQRYPDISNNQSIADALKGIEREIEQLQIEVNRQSEQYVSEVTAAGGMVGEAEGLSYVASLRQQVIQERIAINGLNAKIQVLDSRVGSYQSELQTIPEQSLEIARLERNRLHAERIYEFVVERLQGARIAEESEPGYAYLLRTAGMPSEPVRPDKFRNILLGIVLSMFLGIGLAIVRDKLDNRIYKPDQLRSFGYELIGIIPNLKPLIKSEFGGATEHELDDHKVSTALVTLLAPISSVAEAYRHLRTNIQFSVPDKVVQTILVTSPSVSEGKSTTAANLAIVMAEAGRRTLLIDADLRRPRDHELFGREVSPGLVQFLCREPEFSEEIVKTGIDNLHLAPAGRIVSRSSELLATKRVRDFLDEMRGIYDVIIIDTPPIRVATDAALLSTQCDATLLVTRAGQTREGELQTALDTLEGVGTRIIGVLFNAFDISMAYGYKYRYQHYDRYSQYSKYGYYGYTDSDKKHTA